MSLEIGLGLCWFPHSDFFLLSGHQGQQVKEALGRLMDVPVACWLLIVSMLGSDRPDYKELFACRSEEQVGAAPFPQCWCTDASSAGLFNHGTHRTGWGT